MKRICAIEIAAYNATILAISKERPDGIDNDELKSLHAKLVQTPGGNWALVTSHENHDYFRTLNQALAIADAKFNMRLLAWTTPNGDLIERKNAYHELVSHFGGSTIVNMLEENASDAFDLGYLGALKSHAVDAKRNDYQIPPAEAVFGAFTKVAKRFMW